MFRVGNAWRLQGSSHTRDDSLFSSRFTCPAHTDTGFLNLNTRSEFPTFVAKGRFLLFVRYEASAPRKMLAVPFRPTRMVIVIRAFAARLNLCHHCFFFGSVTPLELFRCHHPGAAVRPSPLSPALIFVINKIPVRIVRYTCP